MTALKEKNHKVLDDAPKRPNLDNYPILVLNADYTPLSYNPLSTWSWRDVMKLVHEDVLIPIHYYDGVFVNSAHEQHPLPSVVVLHERVAARGDRVPFTKYNTFLRDEFRCQYCSEKFAVNDLTFDHVFPQSRGGKTTWENVVAACRPCNYKKDNKTPAEAKMPLRKAPYEPSVWEIEHKGRKYPPKFLHETWLDYLYWGSELES